MSLFGFGIIARAHGPVHNQIAECTQRIEAKPSDPALFLKRAELFRLHREWDRALADCNSAESLGATASDFLRGRILTETGELAGARAAFDRFLLQQPDHPEALLARGRLLMRLDEHGMAERDLSRALGLIPKPDPDHYLDIARAFKAQGKGSEAVRALDEGCERLHSPAALVIEAIEIEASRGNYEGAISRLDKAAAKSARKESWLVRRGEILERAGQMRSAARAFEEAIKAIDSLPPIRRNVKSVEDLRKRAVDGIGRLETSL